MKYRVDKSMQIETPRVFMRGFCISDIPDMLNNWISDPDVQSGYGEPVYTSEAEAAALLDTWMQQYRWAIFIRKTKENIGHVSFCRLYEEQKTAEVEYCIGKAYWGQGIVPEALSAFVSYTFLNTPLEKLEAFHRIANPSSGRVLQKSGFYLADNVLRFSHLPQPPEGDIFYSITRDQFNNRSQ